MSIALYRKYRPKTFSEITNQNHIKITLQNELENDKLAHAYLFCGPRGTGKTTMARLIAKASNCTDLQPKGEPCNACKNCVEIMSGKAMDIIEIDAASHTGVDNVRENIINNARFTPSQTKYKVFIIDEVHMLSTSAFNALLKILEEPPAHVIFVLATTEVHKVPVTIISRCQRFDFKKILILDLIERLRMIVTSEGIAVEEEVLALVAKHSGGCVRDAESLLEQVLSLGDKSISLAQAELVIPPSNYDTILSMIESLLKKDARSAITQVNELVEQGVDVPRTIQQLVEVIRLLLVYVVTQRLDHLQETLPSDVVKKLSELSKNAYAPRLASIIEIILEKQYTFRHSPIVQLPFEIAITEICAGTTAPVAAAPPVPPVQSVASVLTAPVAAPGVSSTPKPVVPAESQKPTPSPGTSKPVASVPDASGSETVPEPKGSGAHGISLTFNQVQSRWPWIVQTIKEKNYSLGMSLSVAKPTAYVGNKITIAFLFDLQKDRVNQAVNKDMMCEVMQQDFGTDITVELIVDASLKLQDISTEVTASPQEKEVIVEQGEEQDPVDQVVSAFGGTLVDGVS